jgi:hypothetical protein
MDRLSNQNLKVSYFKVLSLFRDLLENAQSRCMEEGTWMAPRPSPNPVDRGQRQSGLPAQRASLSPYPTSTSRWTCEGGGWLLRRSPPSWQPQATTPLRATRRTTDGGTQPPPLHRPPRWCRPRAGEAGCSSASAGTRAHGAENVARQCSEHERSFLMFFPGASWTRM